MANPVLVQRLLDTSRPIDQRWNSFLKENPNTYIDLNGADLTGADLSKANLKGANLTNASLIDADLRSADLSGADLDNAQVQGVELDSANLANCKIVGADFSRTTAIRANFSHATIRNTKFQNVVATSSSFVSTNIDLCSFSGASEFDRSDFANSAIARTSFVGVSARGTRFERCRLSETNFQSCKMGDVVFSSATFRDVSLAESDLRQSDFVGCEASGIDFSFADLRGAKLTSAFFLYPVFFKARVAGSQIADAELVDSSPAYEELLALEVAGGDDEPLNESDVQALRELRTMSDSLLGSVSLRQGAIPNDYTLSFPREIQVKSMVSEDEWIVSTFLRLPPDIGGSQGLAPRMFCSVLRMEDVEYLEPYASDKDAEEFLDRFLGECSALGAESKKSAKKILYETSGVASFSQAKNISFDVLVSSGLAMGRMVIEGADIWVTIGTVAGGVFVIQVVRAVGDEVALLAATPVRALRKAVERALNENESD